MIMTLKPPFTTLQAPLSPLNLTKYKLSQQSTQLFLDKICNLYWLYI